jgi:predicted PurR-regulated permease PerM
MDDHSHSKRYLQAAICFGAVTSAFLLLWFASDILLLAFGGVLLAIVFRSAADFLACRVHLTAGWALLIVLVSLTGLVLAALILLGSTINSQVDQLQNDLPAAWDSAKAQLQQNRWGRELLKRAPDAIGKLPQGRGMWTGLLGAFSTTLSALANVVVIFFVGLYFAIDPGLYRRGLLALVPTNSEARTQQVLDRLNEQLRRWLLGKLGLMLCVAVFTALGLWFLRMPLIITLALLAALLDFIPNIGPIISAIPAVLLALAQGPKQALLVALLYLAIQIVESYILQPIVQRRSVSLPPSLTLIAQILMGTLFGTTGLVFATPFTVVLMNLVQMLYVEDVLHKRPVMPG